MNRILNDHENRFRNKFNDVEGKHLDFLYFQICEIPDWDLFDAKNQKENVCS